MSFTVHRILASVVVDDERWAAIEDAPFNPRTGARQWTPDGAKRVVGQRVDRPVTVDEKVQAVADLTRDDEVAAQVATDLLKRPAVTEHVTPAERVRVVTELTRDDTVAQQVTTDLLRRPAVARTAMRDDTTRMLVNRAQFDNSHETRDRIRERTPAIRAIEHTIEYLGLVGSWSPSRRSPRSGPTAATPANSWTGPRERLWLTLRIVSRPKGTKGFVVLPRRWKVERTIGWYMNARRNARDCERLPQHSEAHLNWALITTMTRCLTRKSPRTDNWTKKRGSTS